jgi:hypothetical protein
MLAMTLKRIEVKNTRHEERFDGTTGFYKDFVNLV